MPGKRLIPHVGVQSRGDPIPYSGKGKAVLSIPATGRDTHSCLSSTLLFLIQLSDMQFPKDLPAGIRSRVEKVSVVDVGHPGHVGERQALSISRGSLGLRLN